MYAYSNEYKYIIRWNGKSGCSFFRQLFLYLHESEAKNGITNKWHDLAKDFPIPSNVSNITKIVLVRNPYSRVVSMFCNKYCGGLGHNLLSKKINLSKCTFRHFVHKLYELKMKKLLNNYDVHINEQTYNLNFDKQTYIIKLESFDRDIIKIYSNILNLKCLLPKVKSFIDNKKNILKNITKRNDETELVSDKEYNTDSKIFPEWQYFYDKELIRLVRKIYRNDFINFKYSLKI